MNGIIWFLFYSIMVWTLSIIVWSPIFLLLIPSKHQWRGKLVNQTLSLQLKMQILLSVLLLLVFFFGKFFHYHSPFGHFSHLQIRLWENYPLLGLTPAFVVLSTIYFFFYERSKYWNSGTVRRNPLVVLFALLILFLFGFSVLSDWIFSVPFGSASYEIRFGSSLSRFFHILFSSSALVAAMAILAMSHSETFDAIARYALKWILVGSIIQLFSGTALTVFIGMKNLPVPLGHILLTLAILLTIGIIAMSAVALQKEQELKKISQGTAYTVILTFFVMIALRIVHLLKPQL